MPEIPSAVLILSEFPAHNFGGVIIDFHQPRRNIMSSDQSCNESLLSLFEVHLRTEGYAQNNNCVYIAQARRFLEYLAKHNIAVADTELTDVPRHLRNERQRYRRNHGQLPKSGYCMGSAQASTLHPPMRVIL